MVGDARSFLDPRDWWTGVVILILFQTIAAGIYNVDSYFNSDLT